MAKTGQYAPKPNLLDLDRGQACWLWCARVEPPLRQPKLPWADRDGRRARHRAAGNSVQGAHQAGPPNRRVRRSRRGPGCRSRDRRPFQRPCRRARGRPGNRDGCRPVINKTHPAQNAEIWTAFSLIQFRPECVHNGGSGSAAALRSATFCDGGRFHAVPLTADLQVVRPYFAAGAPPGPRVRADRDRSHKRRTAVDKVRGR